VAQQTGLAPGDSFVGAHGLAPGGHGHDDNPYKVVGILEPTDTVLDRLILTDVRSVWQLHGTDHAHHDEDAHAEQGDHPTHDDHEHHAGHDDDHEHHEHEEGQDAHDDHDHHDGHAEHDEHGYHEAHDQEHHEAHDSHRHHEDASAGHEHEDHAPGAGLPSILAPEFDPAGRQITALLLKSDSLTAGTTLPRLINSASNLQAAAPVAEVTRLLRLIGFGLDTLRAFAGMVVLAAALSVFVALYNALQARRFDLAVMRSLGASRGLLLRHILLEGQVLALAGVLLGLLLGHLVTEGIGLWLSNAQLLRLTGWTWLPAEGYLVLLGAGVGLAAALLPAVGAYRTDIARTLARS
jgi:putative ABC transport system permease protein